MADPEIVSDDDAPEEITLNKGREEAEESRRNEKENSKRLAAELKEKRKARAEKQKEAGSERKKKKEARLEKEKAKEARPETVRGKKKQKWLERKKKVAAITDKNPTNENEVPEKSSSRKRKRDASKGEGELAGKVVGSNMLDDSVVQLIKAREKQVGKGVSVAKHIEEPEPEPKAKKPTPTPSKWPVKDGRMNSRIQIVSLQGKPKPPAINKALKFRNNRFFGSKAVQRSMTMLPTTPFVASV